MDHTLMEVESRVSQEFKVPMVTLELTSNIIVDQEHLQEGTDSIR